MKPEKLIFGAVLIVLGVIVFGEFWSLGYFGPIGAISGAIPMIITGVLMMVLGLIQGRVDGIGRNEKILTRFYIVVSVITLMGIFPGVNSYYVIVGLFLIVIGIILVIPSTKEQKKNRNPKLILSAAVVIIMIIVIILIMNIPPPVLVTPPP